MSVATGQSLREHCRAALLASGVTTRRHGPFAGQGQHTGILMEDHDMEVQSRPVSGLFSRRAVLRAIGAASVVSLGRPAFAARDVGHVGNVSGKGYAGGTLVRPLQAKERLQMGDKVWTEVASRATLVLDLGAVVHMGPEAHLVLDRFLAESSGVLTLERGAIVFDRDDDLPGIDLQIRSAFAQIGLRGTRFFAGPNRGAFSVFVERGSVFVTAAGKNVVLRAGDGVDVPGPGAPASAVTRWPSARISEAFSGVLP